MVVCDYHSKGRGSSFSGSRVTIRTDSGLVVDTFDIPSFYGLRYLAQHKAGAYGRRFSAACARARELDQGG
jgi:hypothetical protein